MLIRITFFSIGLCLLFVFSGCEESIVIDYSGPISDWPSYGATAFGERYSPLTQITPENVKKLKVAWEYHTGDYSAGSKEIPTQSAFEVTPILVDTTMYISTPFNRIIALHPETGEEIWTYDPEIDLSGFYANQLISRGVSFWRDTCANGPCPGRIFSGTNDGRLIALDAATGKKSTDFGINGMIDLKSDVGKERWLGEYQVTSPPAIAGDLVIVGSAVCDNVRLDAPSGVVKAFHARTGELVWSWDLTPPGDSVNYAISEGGYTLGTPNVWAPMSVDEENDLVFIPTGNPAPDYYGGLRKNIDYYGSSIVALKASTGEIAWHFQTVHHDLWDFDVPAQPTLTTITRDGEDIPVVIQATKMGMTFIFNRLTGEPFFEIEEREVPQTDVPGEYTSPTQPFPLKPKPLVPHDLSPEDGWGPLGMDSECKEILAGLHFEGIYTPPKVGQGTLIYPGNSGGSNWGGVSVDKGNQVMIANVMNIAWEVSLIPTEELDSARKKFPGVEIGAQEGAPYGMRRNLLVSSMELPCNPPPWGSLAAVDLQSGDILWQYPLGTVRDIAPVPISAKYGVPNIGGPITTASGLIFIGATLDNYLRAFDTKTGKELWKGRLPAGGQATPMTYRLKPEGKQYVVICAGGHGRAGTKLGDSVIAYALEEE